MSADCHNKLLAPLLLATLALLASCGGGSSSAPEPPAPPPPAPPPVATPPTLDIGGFKVISDEQWTPVAVNKVLATFALGGHATDAQVVAWSELHPVTAIQEILTFDAHNLKLSPAGINQTDGLESRDVSLNELAEFWASDAPENGVPEDRRVLFDYTHPSGWFEHLWPMAITTRGMNPFVHKVAYFEANQHMAVNLASVPARTVIRYYDDLVQALSEGKRYDEVLAVAASSAAIAHQYGHGSNRYVNNECSCNEDFAREFYQLFFGITGVYSPPYHETITIKNTALALTDMRLLRDSQSEFTAEIEYGTDFHPVGELQMLGTFIGGSNARERLSELSAFAIEHPESLEALPVLLIRGLADDNLTPTGEETVKAAWASMSDKDLLLFLRAYAISPTFHSATRIKYWTSLERRLLVTNKISSSNSEIYNRIYSVVGHLLEGVQTFRPSNNVFGDQTGEMASDSLDVFLQNYNQTTDQSFQFRRYTFSDSGFTWTKDWRNVIKTGDAAATYTVENVALYLWNRLTSDGGKNFGTLERAHVYALLGSNSGLAGYLDPDNLDHVYTEAELESMQNADKLAVLGATELLLNSSNAAELELTSHRIGQAVSFIASTPFMFYQEGN